MLRPKRRGRTQPRASSAADRNPMNAYARAFLEWSAVRGASEQTVQTRKGALKRFIAWCDERELVHPKDITLPILERYQRYLYYYRKPNGAPLAFGSQQTMLAPLKRFFQWATRERHLLYNPASELLLPRVPRRLPRYLLSVADLESILNQPDIETAAGVRDRAILETLYSSEIRRTELAKLGLYDVDPRGGELAVRAGKGGKDRIVPLGERAAAWLERYLEEVRPAHRRRGSRDVLLDRLRRGVREKSAGGSGEGLHRRRRPPGDRLLSPVPPCDGDPHVR
jgi:integrase/recombinase XerD